MIRRVALVLWLLALSGCSESSDTEGPMYGPNTVFRSIGIVVPRHYDAWVDTLMMESISKNIGWRAPIGIVSCCWKKPHGAMADWQTMPELFVIRWFSFAEQQSYHAVFRLENPDEIEEKMKESAPFERFGEMVDRPRYNLVLGLAPGGTVVVWIMNRGENAIEVGRYKAKPYDHKERGEDYTRRTESYLERQGEYLQQHGVKYDGW